MLALRTFALLLPAFLAYATPLPQANPSLAPIPASPALPASPTIQSPIALAPSSSTIASAAQPSQTLDPQELKALGGLLDSLDGFQNATGTTDGSTEKDLNEAGVGPASVARPSGTLGSGFDLSSIIRQLSSASAPSMASAAASPASPTAPIVPGAANNAVPPANSLVQPSLLQQPSLVQQPSQMTAAPSADPSSSIVFDQDAFLAGASFDAPATATGAAPQAVATA
ncbi:hypothetical protein JCM10296v2_001343 [Rhodotorula toruloides]